MINFKAKLIRFEWQICTFSSYVQVISVALALSPYPGGVAKMAAKVARTTKKGVGHPHDSTVNGTV